MPDKTSSIREWQDAIHALAIEKGWWSDGQRNVGEALMLIVTEVAEAMECYRTNDLHTRVNADFKPEGFGVELADAVIRIFDLAGGMGIDLAGLIQMKHEYNQHRPHRHGGKAA